MPTAAVPSSSTSSTAQVLELPLDLLEDSPFQVKRYDTARVKDHYSMMHPALFELLARMSRECLAAEKRLVLFGEGAADPVRVPFYMGVGITELSVAPVRLNGLLKVLKRFTLDECQRIANAVLEAPRPLDVQRILVQVAD